MMRCPLKNDDCQSDKCPLEGCEKATDEQRRHFKVVKMIEGHVRRAYIDGIRYAVRLVRDYENEHNKEYRERIARFIEGKIKE